MFSKTNLFKDQNESKEVDTDELINISLPRVQLSHELLTPLNSILGFTQILRTEKNLEPSHVEAVKAIHESSENLLKRINELFRLSDSSNGFEFFDNPDNQKAIINETRILVVDDAATNRLVLKNMLLSISKTKIIIDEAVDGNYALKKIEKKQPDIVLMDLYMPEKDGFQTAKEIRMNPLYNDIFLIAISADSFAFDEKELNEYGFNTFIVKPVKMNQLKEIILGFSKSTDMDKEEDQDRKSLLSYKELLPDKKNLEKLLNYSRQGAYSDIKQFLGKLEKMQPEYKEFVSQIQALLKKFQFRNIANLIQNKLSGN